MRELTLPEIPPLPTSVDDCIARYCQRLRDGKTPLPNIGTVLLGHMAWPNDQAPRDQWMETLEARSIQNPRQISVNVTTPALTHLSHEFSLQHAQWPHVADVLQMVVDMSYDTQHGDALRGGASISKAVDLLENEKDVPTHAPLRSAWSKFRDVAHLITAAAFLAEKGQGTGKPHAGTIFNAVWLAPDATLSLAFGYQEFGLRLRPHGQKKPILHEDTLWRIPANAEPEKLLLPVRRLTEAQVALLETRRARKK